MFFEYGEIWNSFITRIDGIGLGGRGRAGWAAERLAGRDPADV